MELAATSKTFTKRALALQGFDVGPSCPVNPIQSWLRLTPALSGAWLMTGTAMGSPAALLSFSLLSAVGASLRKHPFDYLYDKGIRRVTHGPSLPDNPPPRRFAMALASGWASAAALLLAKGYRRSGLAAAAALSTAAVLVATTHFCLGSWVYKKWRAT